MHREGSIQRGIKFVVPRERHGLGGVGLLVPNHVGVLVAQANIFGAQAELCVGIHQVRKVRPLHDEFGIVEFVLKHVTNEGHHESRIGAGTNRQPDIRSGRVRRKPRIHDHRAHAARAQFRHGSSAARRRVSRRGRSP